MDVWFCAKQDPRREAQSRADEAARYKHALPNARTDISAPLDKDLSWMSGSAPSRTPAERLNRELMRLQDTSTRSPTRERTSLPHLTKTYHGCLVLRQAGPPPRGSIAS